MNRIVVDLLDRRPIWAIPDWAIEELREAIPDGWTLVAATSRVDGSGDGEGGPTPEVLEMVRGARVYLGYGIRPEVLEVGGGTLEWVHTGTAGVGGSLHSSMRRSSVRFTNSAGIHGPPIAESVVGMVLYFARGFDYAVRAQASRRWDPHPFFLADTEVREISSMRIGILGYGGIGREVGRRLRGLGAEVLGLRRTAPAGAERDASAIESGIEVIHGPSGLQRLLAESEVLVVTAPDTAETRGILDRDAIRAMPRGTILVNVSRGSLVDQEAMVEALRRGHLRGAALDVTTPEPLPSDHPLWGLPNVLILPHVSGVSRGFWRREIDLIVENLRRFVIGAPLVNEVDRTAGY